MVQSSAWTRRSTLQPAGRPALQIRGPSALSKQLENYSTPTGEPP
jgi:hypothetical protein